MKKSTKMVKLYSGLLAAAVTASTFGGALMTAVPAFADEGIETYAGQSATTYYVENGAVSMGRGTASIKVQGDQENAAESMDGKTFEIFKLFNAENSLHNESINYTFNPTYQTALQTVVAARLNEENGTSLQPAEVTEYMVIDYIQMYLNTQPDNEGAQTDQRNESYYSDFRRFTEEVRDEIKAEGLHGDIIQVNSTNDTNSFTISGLDYGYYFLDETTQNDPDGGDYYASSLIMVNTANPNAEVNLKSDMPSSIKKIQEDDNKVTVGNDGWNDTADYEIGQTVPFKLTYEVSDMNGYDFYYWAVHDQMDPGLTFHANKSEISIVVSKDGYDDYKLADSEYNLITSGESLDEGDTFMLEVQDIKKIIDQHFKTSVPSTPEQDTTGHHDYSDMTITVQYSATLNDNAVVGLPGNENDFRIEFSNNPDSDGNTDTGYTPWDTVVAFTFRMNGLKVNNHDMSLEGAQFRLYSDAACTQEVYLKVRTTEEARTAGISTMAASTDNIGEPDGDEHNYPGETVDVGGNAYNVINRDSIGGTDHTGGSGAPAESVPITTDEDGNFTIYGLDEGTYYLKEVDAPDGYRPLLDPIVLTVKPTLIHSNDYVAGAANTVLTDLTASAHIKEFYDGEYREGDATLQGDLLTGSFDLKIVNEVGTKLPVTGSSAMLIMLGAGVALMGGAVVISRRKKVAR